MGALLGPGVVGAVGSSQGRAPTHFLTPTPPPPPHMTNPSTTRADALPGSTSACGDKSARAAYDRARRAAKADELREKAAAYRAANRKELLARKKARYAANREELLARKKTPASRERENARRRDEYRTDRAKIVARNAASYARHAETRREAARAWRAENTPKVTSYSAARRAREQRATPEWADSAEIARVYEEAQRFRALGIDVHVDHIYPLRGRSVCGLHVHQNLRVIPAEDNLKKGNKLEEVTL